MLAEKKIAEFLEELAAGTPTPGGGTVAGVSAATAAALIEMVCNLTIGKRKYHSVEAEMKNVKEEAAKLREVCLLLAEKDAIAFDGVMKAIKMPQKSEEEAKARREALQEASKKAALVPMDILRRCENLARLCITIVAKGNENAISDAGVAASLIYSAAQSASLNILINLSTIQDEDFVGKLKTEQAKVLKSIKDMSEEAKNCVLGKL